MQILELLTFEIIFCMIFYPANIYLFKVTNRNNRKRSEICSKLMASFCCFVYFEHISLHFVVFLRMSLNNQMLAGLFYIRISKLNWGLTETLTHNPAGNCMLKVDNRNTRTRCEICSELTIKTPERRQLLHAFVSLLLTLNIFHNLSLQAVK